jgi:hypothetical protein
LQHPLFVVIAVSLAENLADPQLEHLVLAQTDAEDVARLSQDTQEKSDLFIDGFWSGAFFESVILVSSDGRFAEINQHLASEQALQMVDCVLRESSRIW